MAESNQAKRPNVLIIIMDDLAWGDLGCHGNKQTNTPNLDRLHDQSTQLTRYCSGPLCTPARAALMTGRHPYRTRAFDTYIGRAMLDPDEVTLAELMRDAGYATGIFGKWHLGDCYPMRAMDKGFNEAVVHNSGGLAQPGNPRGTGNPALHDYFDPPLLHNGKVEHYKGYCTDIFADEAMKFISKHADERWFCYLATNAPHCPMIVGDKWAKPHLDAGVPEKLAKFYGMVDNIDWNVGRVMRLLDENKLADDTIVIYTSDHGPCPSASIDGVIRYNAGLRGGKGSMYEGGLRVPCFWRWPGVLRANHAVDRLANPIDVMPTLADVCGLRVPNDRKIDGTSLWPVMSGKVSPSDWPDRAICMQWHRGDEPVRYHNAVTLTQRYKWYRPAEWNLASGTTYADELYDIEADPGEQHNIAGDHPQIVERLRGVYERWLEDVSHERPDNFAPPRIVVGSSHENPTVLSREDFRLYPGVPEGWGLKNPGYWQVRIERGGAYRVCVNLKGVTSPVKFHFKCGDAERSAEPRIDDAVKISETWFEDVRLEAGDCTVDAWCEQPGNDQRLAVWEVVLHAPER